MGQILLHSIFGFTRSRLNGILEFLHPFIYTVLINYRERLYSIESILCESEQRAMTASENESGGIYTRHTEAENVVSSVQMQGGDAQTASELVQLAQVMRGERFALTSSGRAIG